MTGPSERQATIGESFSRRGDDAAVLILLNDEPMFVAQGRWTMTTLDADLRCTSGRKSNSERPGRRPDLG